ncbi:MAG: hypothetical protein QUV07_15775 [Cyanobium sp. CZS 25K]|nr:hypothetical protein [Cyanobium sp. CZS25K]
MPMRCSEPPHRMGPWRLHADVSCRIERRTSAYGQLELLPAD